VGLRYWASHLSTSPGQETRQASGGESARRRESPPLPGVDSLARCGWERRPAWRRVSAVRKCSFLFFSVLRGRPRSRFFFFLIYLDTEADLAQEEISSGRDRFPLPESRWQNKKG
jgi:hypothetical protein